ncbi:hypothetical protein PRIPAC_73514 [Pristionchus pacificus]|uniref:Uncharacterized protein n=1 Tax=Pristionchus pacificus TaxID=54126 RepID=A0A2A6CS18_PRIPA|nr:hypothetical protein PRIPAC_73514 [Pristionchus pacificus]|eukprot:PDM80857.1 hypothetical protein PRIPAC_35860 [Pristionchus pacificus]
MEKILKNDITRMVERASATGFLSRNNPHGLFIDKGFPIESLKRIMKNATFGFMSVNITGDSELLEQSVDIALNIYALLPECNIVELVRLTERNNGVRESDFSMLKDIMVDNYFLRLINACCKLKLGGTSEITAVGLHTLYKRVMDRTCKLYFIDFEYTPAGLLKEFLLLIGITFEGGELFSERNVEVGQFIGALLLLFTLSQRVMDRTCKLYFIDFEYTPAGLLKEFLLLIGITFEGGELFSERNVEVCNFKNVLVEAADDEEGEEMFRMNKHVFDDNLEMIFGHDDDDTTGWLSMNYNRTIEDLMKDKAKKGLVRLEVSPQ